MKCLYTFLRDLGLGLELLKSWFRLSRGGEKSDSLLRPYSSSSILSFLNHLKKFPTLFLFFFFQEESVSESSCDKPRLRRANFRLFYLFLQVQNINN